jgi:hypothetical protein
MCILYTTEFLLTYMCIWYTTEFLLTYMCILYTTVFTYLHVYFIYNRVFTYLHVYFIYNRVFTYTFTIENITIFCTTYTYYQVNKNILRFIKHDFFSIIKWFHLFYSDKNIPKVAGHGQNRLKKGPFERVCGGFQLFSLIFSYFIF